MKQAELSKMKAKARKALDEVFAKLPEGYGLAQMNVVDLNYGLEYAKLILQKK